jgi:hypothetical protein
MPSTIGETASSETDCTRDSVLSAEIGITRHSEAAQSGVRLRSRSELRRDKNEMRFPASREADGNAKRCHRAAEARTANPACARAQAPICEC